MDVDKNDVIDYLISIGYVKNYTYRRLEYICSITGSIISEIDFISIYNSRINPCTIDLSYHLKNKGYIHRITTKSLSTIKHSIFRDFPEIKSDYRKRQIAKI